MLHENSILDQPAYHFVTFTVAGGISVFNSPKYCDVLIDAFRFFTENQGLRVHSYVIMPNQVHSILSATEPKNDLRSVIDRFKSFTCTQLVNRIAVGDDFRKAWMLSQFEYAAKRDMRNKRHQLWNSAIDLIELSNGFRMIQMLNYIHHNPVKKGIVQFPWHYLYSSARDYEGLHGKLELDLFDVEIGLG